MVSPISVSEPMIRREDLDLNKIPMTTSEDQNTVGHISRDTHTPLHLRTQEGVVQDNTGLVRRKRKRMRMRKSREAASSSFVIVVTDVNLNEDAVILPRDLTSSCRFKRRNSKIIITDGGERSWEMNLRYNSLSDTFCISRGWRHFCIENGKNEGSSFTFQLMRTGDMPLLSFSPTESVNDRAQEDQMNQQQRFVSFKLSYDSFKHSRLYLSLKFLRKNGLGQPRIVTLVGKNGTRTLGNLLRESSGRMSIGMGLKDFAKANGLRVGDRFTLKICWNKGLPMLVLVSIETGSRRRQQGDNSSKPNERNSVSMVQSNGKKTKKDVNIIGESSNSSTLKDNRVMTLAHNPEDVKACTLEANEIEPVPKKLCSGKKTKKNMNNTGESSNASLLRDNRSVTLALKPEDVNACTLYIPTKFIRENGVEKLGRITILGKNEMKCCGYLLTRDGTVAVDCGWETFCEANGVTVGDPFTLEYLDEEEETPVYKFSPSYPKT